jgi:hypothetical protein
VKSFTSVPFTDIITELSGAPAAQSSNAAAAIRWAARLLPISDGSDIVNSNL